MSPYWDGGWQAHTIDDWETGGTRLILFRRVGDETEVIVGFDEHGMATVERTVNGATSCRDFQGFLLPRDAVEAIAARVNPGPSKAEVTRLEEALAIERKRVDDVLLAMWGDDE